MKDTINLIYENSLRYSLQQVDVSKIIVQDRIRKDLGNISELASAIDLVGLLQPICVTQQNVLVYGQRRLEAVKNLGWKTIPALVLEDEQIDR